MKRVFYVFVAFVVFGCATLRGQVFDEATFNDVMPVPTTGTDVMHTLNNSGSLEAISLSGVITEINTATFASEIQMSYNGSGVSASSISLSTTTGFVDSIAYEIVVPIDDGFGGPVAANSGDGWTFNFLESFDDGSDGLADASVDVNVKWHESVPVASESDLGSFTLNDGFYDRSGFGGDADHPFTQVAFEVSADGIYSLESDWDDGLGGSFDGYLYLFDQMFDGTDDTNNIALDDDGPEGTADSRIESVFLEQGTTYYALMTSFGSQAGETGLMGDLRVGSLLGNTASIVAVPEPSTGITVLFGLVLFASKRRRP